MTQKIDHWFDRWWPRLRDVGAFLVGVFLLTKPSLSATQAAVGVACIGVTVSGIARYALNNGNNKRDRGTKE